MTTLAQPIWPLAATDANGQARQALTALLHSQATTARPAGLRRLQAQVLLPLAAVAALLAAWSAWAPLAGAVVATGQVQATLGRKPVQHQEGGIVRELLVQPGQAVRRGDALLVVADVRTEATLDMQRKAADAERLRAARSRAELALAAGFAPPANMPTDSADAVQREQQLFDARRQTLQAQLAALQAQQRDARQRISALSAQLASSDRGVGLARDEMAVQQQLVDAGFVQRTRLLGMERGVADAQARAEAIRGQIAEAQMQVGALDQAQAQTRGAYQQRAADELKDATARLRELDDRLRPAQDQADRQTVRAPVDGTVMALRVGAVGSVVGPREPLLEIAPSDERLVVALRINPQDIDHVRLGGAAEVRLAAYDSRRTPLLAGTVTALSPDISSEPSADTASRSPLPAYTAQVTVQPEALAGQPGLRLQAGMPAEVFITTAPRSLLSYLLQPLGLFAHRALREP